MKTKDALKILYSLPKSGKNDFEKFMQSPFFNAQDNIYDLYKVILRNIDKLVFEDNDRIRQILGKKLKISDTALRKKLSHFCGMVMKFKKTKFFLDDELTSDVLIGRHFLDNGMISVFEGQMSRTEEKLQSSSEFREDALYMNYLHNVSGYNYISRSSIGDSRWVRTMQSNYLDSAFSNYMLYTIIQMSGLYLNVKISNLSAPEETGKEFPLSLGIFFDGNGYAEYFSANQTHKAVYTAYKLMYNAFENFNATENFIEYREFVEEHKNLLGFEVSRTHNGVLMSYCFIKEKLNENTDYFVKESTVLLYNYVKEGYYSTGGDDFLSPDVYRNFVLTAYSLGNYELLYEFILANSSKLNPGFYNDMIYLANAYYYYGIKDYGKTLKYINDLKFPSFIYRFDVRNIEIRVLYEKGHYDVLLNMLRSYAKMVNSDKMLMKKEKETLTTFIKYLNKLVIIKLTADRKEQVKNAEMLYHQVSKSEPMALRSWLIGKIQEVYAGVSVKAG